MEAVQLNSKAQSAARYEVSHRLCNAAAGVKFSIEHPVFEPARRRWALPLVSQATVQSASSQLARNPGQTALHHSGRL